MNKRNRTLTEKEKIIKKPENLDKESDRIQDNATVIKHRNHFSRPISWNNILSHSFLLKSEKE